MSNYRRNNWGIIGNITGRFVKNKKGVQEFVPNFTHKYSTIPQIMRLNPDKSKKEIMAEEGLSIPLIVREPEVVVKTAKEKRMIKVMKKSHRKDLRYAGLDPNKRLNLSEPSILRAS